jgi:hypothetical protein
MPPTSTEQTSDSLYTLSRVRQWVLWILIVEMIGTGAELLLIAHFADPWQWLPIGLIALALLVLGWFSVDQSAVALRILRVILLLFIISGGIGMVQHLRAKIAFQSEVNPALQGLELFWTAIKSVAPPALAPGVMIQMGLLGLVWSYGYLVLQRPQPK